MPHFEKRIANLANNLKEYAEGSLILNSKPPVIFVELTQNCNLHCVMCRSSKDNNSKLNMPLTLFYKLVDSLFPFAHTVDLRGWGESTILPDFEERLFETIVAGPRVRLVTNALALKQSTWKLLMDSDSSVVVSVDAAFPETYKLLGRGSMEKLIASLDAGSSARDGSCKGRIMFNTVLNSLNLEELPDIVCMASRYKISRVTVFPIIIDRKNPLHLIHRRTTIQKYIYRAASMAREFQVELRLGACLDEGTLVSDALRRRCLHPWSYIYIDYAGRVGYCDHLIGHPELTIGDLAKDSFDNIWNGLAFQQLRKEHLFEIIALPKSLRKYEHCAWCYSHRYIDFEDDIHFNSISSVISTTGSLPLFGEMKNIRYMHRDFLSNLEI